MGTGADNWMSKGSGRCGRSKSSKRMHVYLGCRDLVDVGLPFDWCFVQFRTVGRAGLGRGVRGQFDVFFLPVDVVDQGLMCHWPP